MEFNYTEAEKLIKKTEKLIAQGFGSSGDDPGAVSELLEAFKELFNQKDIYNLNEKYSDNFNMFIRQMKIILDNIPIGIVIVDEERLVTPSYSLIMHKMFDQKKISGMFIEDVIYPEDVKAGERKTFVDWLGLVFEISHDWDLIGDIGPEIIEYERDGNIQYYNMNYQRVVTEGRVAFLLIYIVNVTGKIRQEKEILEQKSQQNFELEIFSAIIGQENSSELVDFIYNSREILDTCMKLLSRLGNTEERFDLYNDIFRHMHSIKGLAKTYGLNEFARYSHETEDILTSLRSGDISYDSAVVDNLSVRDKIDELISTMQNHLDRTEKILKKFVNRGMDTATAIRKQERWIKVSYDKIDELLDICDSIDADCVNHSEKVQLSFRELKNNIREISLQPFDVIYKRLSKIVKEVSNALSKKVKITSEGDELLLSYKTHHLVINSILHLLRNALDHGLEMPKQRRAAGKSETGEIIIRTSLDGCEATILFGDDGAGIDPDVIAQKALEKGLIQQSELETMSADDKLKLILLPGLSCRDEADDISGRGVGMDVVSDSLNKIGGTLKIESEIGSGTMFYLTFPVN